MMFYSDLIVILIMGIVMAGSITGCSESPDNARWLAGRQAMVQQLRAYRITDERILQAMSKVRRQIGRASCRERVLCVV